MNKSQFTVLKQSWDIENDNSPDIYRRTTSLGSEQNVCLFICFKSHEQFFSYLATVTIAGDRDANSDLCLALTAFSREGSFTCHTYCDTGPPFLRSYPKDPWFYLLNAVLFAKEQSLPIFKRLTFDAAGLGGARTHDLPSAKREHYH
jgi:hypothetical protein